MDQTRRQQAPVDRAFSRATLSVVRRLALLTLLSCAGRPALAGDESLPIFAASPPLPEALKDFTDQGGLRSQLEKAGLTFTFSYFGDALGNPSGGVRQGAGYSGRLGEIVDGDLEKLVGWSGATFHASVHEIYGYGLSANNLDNLMVVSSVEAPNSIRLFNLWIEQKLNGTTSLRVGQFTAAQEFLVSNSANLFVNSTFGWPVLPAQDLPSGGPAYPVGALGVRLIYRPNDQFAVRAAVFDGDPAGAGLGNSLAHDPYGLAFRLGDPAFMIAEAVYHYNHDRSDLSQDNLQQEGDSSTQSPAAPSVASGLPGTIKFGAWYISGSFADPRYNGQSSMQPPDHGGNYSAYAIFDQMIWRDGANDNRNLRFFLRAEAAPGDRNLIDLYADAGLNFVGPLDSRPADSVGIAFAFGRVSPQVAAYDREWDGVTKIQNPIRNFEATLEVTYQYKLAKNWTLQPDFQYIVHPGANVANPQNPNSTAPIPNAAVIGLRMVMKF